MALTLSTELTQQIHNHILQQYPKEACGIIAAGNYIPCTNTAIDPLNAFCIDVKDYAQHQISGTLQAVVHSHPFALHPLNKRLDPRTPSHKDQLSWIAMNVPFVIFNTNGTEVSEPLILDDANPAPLVGREFIHGYHDCYGVVRDYYRMKLNIDLPRTARGWEWWATEQTLYEDNWQAAGFVEVPRDEFKVNDLILMQVHAKTINHAAVITGQNEILHHLFYRLSGYDSLSRWGAQIARVIRHKSIAR